MTVQQKIINKNYVTLTTIQGHGHIELKELVGDRQICIWGAGFLGKVVFTSLTKQRFCVKYFCDLDLNNFKNRKLYDIEILEPKSAIEKARDGNIFFIICVSSHVREIRNQCIDSGLQKNIDFITYNKIRRPEVVFDVTNFCDLRCPSCPQSNLIQENERKNLLTFGDFKDIFNKLERELEFITKIEFGWWAEPTLNKDLGDMIKYCKNKVLTSVNTNLFNREAIDNLVEAEPDMLVVSVGGVKSDYEWNYLGSSWETLKNNLEYLAKSTVKTENYMGEVRVLFHKYKNSNKRPLKEICENLSLKLTSTTGYLNPYEHYFNYSQGIKFDSKTKQVVQKLDWDLDEFLSEAKSQIGKPCLCQRIFPIINADKSVALCHVYQSHRVVENVLKHNINELIGLRHSHSFCRKCQSLGLHRLDVDLIRSQR